MNDFLTIDMVTLEALAVLENELTFTRQIPRKYDDYFAKSGAKIGDKLRVRKPIRNRVRKGQGYQPQPINETFVDVILTTQAGIDCDFSTADFSLKIDEFSDRILKPQISQLANQVDDDGLQMAILANMAVGVPGTPIATPTAYLMAGAKLKSAAAPLGDWCMVINPLQEASIVGGLTQFFNPVAEISRQYKKGVMGTAFGFEWYMDQNVFTHHTGQPAGNPVVDGPNQSGSTLLTTGWTPGATLAKGDVIQVTGMESVNPKNYRSTGILADLVVMADCVADGNGDMEIPIQTLGMQGIVGPGPNPTQPDPFQNVTALPADTAPILFYGLGQAQFSTAADKATPTGVGFHPDFATLVSADLYLPKGVDMGARKADKQLGFSMRFIRDYDPVTDQLVNRFDILYGWAMLRNELVVRIQT